MDPRGSSCPRTSVKLPIVNRLSAFPDYSSDSNKPPAHAVSAIPMKEAKSTGQDIQLTTNGAKMTATIVINLIKMLRLGPDVSLNGSPTVSPMTAAL